MRILPRLVAAALLASSMSGCLLGMSSEKFRAASSPAGAELQIRTRKARIVGELVEVRDSGVVIAPPGDLMLVPFGAIRSAVATQTNIRFSGKPRQNVHERLRLLSRYPAGIPAEALERLLAIRGHQALRVYQP